LLCRPWILCKCIFPIPPDADWCPSNRC
jgi:hypothetical protein